jgi:hypothetical protein
VDMLTVQHEMAGTGGVPASPPATWSSGGPSPSASQKSPFHGP